MMLLLPAWTACLESLKMKFKLIPQDVTTRWNSTYDMLKFVLDHRKAIDKFTADKDNNLRQLELSTGDWKMIKQLCDILEVHVSFHGLLT